MLGEIRDAVIIHNPLAGHGRKQRAQQLEVARRILTGAGIEAELLATAETGAATALARQAVEQGRQLVIVCGGDGTVNETVNGLAGSQVPLAVLPAGTANVLAKELGIPWNIPRAAALIPQGRLQRVALGMAAPLAAGAARRFFLCVAGAGPDGVMVYSVNPAFKLRAGILAYWLEGLGQLFRYRFPSFRVTAAGREMECTLVVVGRTKHYGGPFRITTGADLLKSEFELFICTTSSRWRYLSYLPALWLGRLRSMPEVHFWKTTSLRCEPLGDAPVYAQVDGEPAGKLPVEFSIVPDALTLVFPGTTSEK
ncbi:MAG: diacylglycerol kinase family protein [Candidatus Acidiferrales bacterium]